MKRVLGVDQYRSVLEQIRERGRTPLVVSSLGFPVPTGDLIAQTGVNPEDCRNAYLKTLGKACVG